MSSRLLVRKLTVKDFRNLARVELEPGPNLNVFSGDNGQGKTALLEAIYAVATSRSFRTSKASELVRHDAQGARVHAALCEVSTQGEHAREQTVVLARGRVDPRIDGNKPESLSRYATTSPAVVFSALDLALSAGPSAGRRKLVDRLALFGSASYGLHRERYARALRARQALLLDEGANEGALRAYEDLAANHGAAVTSVRSQATEAYATILERIFRAIAPAGLELSVRYAPGGDVDPARSSAELAQRRRRDLARGSASFGPHKDDLDLRLDGRVARLVASQGQHRAITLALKMAEAEAIRAVRGVGPALLLDDVSSELDADRTDALFGYLASPAGMRAQIFLTTTRPDLIPSAGFGADTRRDFVVRGGVIERSGAS